MMFLQGCRSSVYRHCQITRQFRTSAVAPQDFSRFDVPDVSSLPDDVREKMTEVAEKVN